ncbi:renin receptor isoform X2 [Copidosoma floridanum]|uniref:renin receptor isoform X2 n=1 Tax=Copidosoma floridanum TaxID=29053 RepID=UPI0006C94236|nr:renin receptor isoform X2 [Copidosoma floridanum]
MLYFKLLWALAALVVCARATGTFVVLYAPDNVRFESKNKLNQSEVKEVLAAALSYPAYGIEWDGLSYKVLSKLPNAAVAVVVDGVDSLEGIHGKKFHLKPQYENEEYTWQALSKRLEKGNNYQVRLNLNDGVGVLGQSALGELKPNPPNQLHPKALNLTVKADEKFLEELQLLHAIADKIKTKDKVDVSADLYWFVVSGLKPVVDMYGSDSEKAKEAITLLDETLQALSKVFRDVYDDSVLITAFTNHVHSSNVRRKRDVPITSDGQKKEEESNANKEEMSTGAPSKINEEEYTGEKSESYNENLAEQYSEDFPVIFNIILWFMVIFLFSLLAICIFIAEMDPGRDSIIYRMTSNRMKKDN